MAGMSNAASVDSGPTAAFRAARDLLLAHRTDYAAARAGFAWPELDEFNWALDWFDVIARRAPASGPRCAIVGDDGDDAVVSYARDGRPVEPGRQRGCAAWASGAATGCCSCSATWCRCGKSCWRR